MPSILTRGAHASVLLAALLLSTTACNGTVAETPQPSTGNSVETAASTATQAPEAAAPVDAATASPAAQASDDWSGRYTYEFSDGTNAAGTGVTVTYTLTLAPGSCRFSAEGYQTDETILCTTKPIANGIDVAFKSYDDGRTTDKYDNQVYSVGDPLFALERQAGKVLTHWKGYPLPDEKPHPKGVYFQR